MKSNAICFVLALVSAGAASAAVPMLLEERVARDEEKLILDHPIAGIENSLWFDYRGDVIEAQKELSSDLRRASDIEDKRDAWEEYAVELKNEREDYIHDMAKRGFRQGSVTIID
ncbi:hypothetical protein [Qipengyuania sp. RANM35]|uniref:hypothetical protein n=1 Tax=Qipengyuania sp. RANM35 TaxID=3068635 RepID=UPI0034DAD747